MNRTLLFRAWDKKRKKMRQDISTGTISIWGNGNTFDEESKASDCEFMQFTGLLDSKGKEIYEGDVVSKDNTPFEIRFINGCFVLSYLPEKGFWLDIRSTLESMEGTDIHYDTLSSYEIIGNIFENPDLLKDHLIK